VRRPSAFKKASRSRACFWKLDRSAAPGTGWHSWPRDTRRVQVNDCSQRSKRVGAEVHAHDSGHYGQRPPRQCQSPPARFATSLTISSISPGLANIRVVVHWQIWGARVADALIVSGHAARACMNLVVPRSLSLSWCEVVGRACL